MPLARSWSVALVGMEGHVVEVEADLASGIPGLSITGLPDAALTEARDRVKAAVVNSGVPWPQKKITLGLSPAALPKRGSHFDLALAAALVAAGDERMAARLRGLLLLGELGLDGRVRPVAGVLPALLAGARHGFARALVPAENLAEARLVEDVTTAGVRELSDVLDLLRGRPLREVAPVVAAARPADALQPDYLDVVGQPLGRLACEVVAAGGHNLLFTGPPGCGKTLLAERLPGLLPPLSREESLQVSAIHSVAGVLPGDSPLLVRPPFQAPHHGATTASVVGGGSGLAKPGAASLAHRGVLFLDEAQEVLRTCYAGCEANRELVEARASNLNRAGTRPGTRDGTSCASTTEACPALICCTAVG